MRILYCNKYNFTFSGTEVHLFDLMKMMRAHRHEAALFSMADPRGEPTPYDSHFVRHIDFKSGQSRIQEKVQQAAHAVYSREARKKLSGMIEAFRPDVAHIRNIYHHLSPSILWELKAHKIPVVYHLNDFKLLCPSYNLVSHGRPCERCCGGNFWHVVTEGCYAGPPGAPLVLAAEAYLHKWLQTYKHCVNRFLAPSWFVKEKFVQHGWGQEAIEVLPHFQALPLKPPPEPARNAPILYFGRLSPEKGVDDLLRAMALVPSVRLVIAGDGPQREELQHLAVNLHNVEFVGHLQGAKLESLIAASRFTVLPSHAYETMGKSILESYAWGRAVIASDLGSRRELVRHGETGILFPPGDVEQIASAITLLDENSEAAAKMGSNGRATIQQHHSPDDHYREMVRIYEELCPPACSQATWNARLPPKCSLRIAFIGGRGVMSKYSGIETYYEEVGWRLAGMGHHVTVHCRTYFTQKVNDYQGMRIVRLPTIRSKSFETLIHTFLSTIHAACSDCDIIHYQCLGPALFSLVPRLFGKKTVVTVQGLDWRRKKWGRIASAVLRVGEWAALRLPDATMVVSQTLRQHYLFCYGANTIYVPNGTSLRNRTRAGYLTKWGLMPGNYILFLGRFSPEKNCHLLIEAYEKIDTPTKLVLAGGSSHSDEYANQLRSHQSDRVRLLDWQSGDALDELLTNAMLFVLPSDLEGLSLALLDALGAGVCVLASDIPENREAMEGAGFTFLRGDVHDLGRMLRLLISNGPLRLKAANRGRERVRERFLWDKVAKEVEQVYMRLLAGQQRSRFPRVLKLISRRSRPAA